MAFSPNKLCSCGCRVCLPQYTAGRRFFPRFPCAPGCPASKSQLQRSKDREGGNMQPIMTIEEIHEFLDREFPQIHMDGRVLSVTDVRPGGLTMRFEPGERHLRPGATVSGPAMVMLADVAAYAVILAHIGPV